MPVGWRSRDGRKGEEKEEEDKEEGVMMVTGEGTQMQGAELILSFVARHVITTP